MSLQCGVVFHEWLRSIAPLSHDGAPQRTSGSRKKIRNDSNDSNDKSGIGRTSRNKKRASPMAVNRLAPLHGARVSVELVRDGQPTILRGVARYGTDPSFGRHLSINVRESWGDFDFILREDEWDGEIAPGGTSDCDFQIRLTAECTYAK
jgi:hypothetical protein